MSISYQSNKESIYRWKATHIDRWRAYGRKTAKRKYDWNKISKVFLSILLPDSADSPDSSPDISPASETKK